MSKATKDDENCMQARTVFVSGCFDLLHSGHVSFLQAASQLGRLWVAVGSDATIAGLKGRPPVNTQAERLFLVSALACVEKAFVSTGSGYLDFEAELRELRPDAFFVNEDGDHPQKRALCTELGIEYHVANRTPAAGLPARTSTDLRNACRIPHRLELSGGWLDQPMISSLASGSVIVASIWPEFEVPGRSGLATSAHAAATRLWGEQVPPAMNSATGGELLFAVDNPPGKQEISGSQDSLGIVLPGVNRLHYSGGYLPDRIGTIRDDRCLNWLESVVQLIPTRPRPAEYSPLVGKQINQAGAQALQRAADRTWQAIEMQDAELLGESFSECLTAQVQMFPAMLDNLSQTTIASLPAINGCKFSGAGGGGYLLVVAKERCRTAQHYRIRRYE